MRLSIFRYVDFKKIKSTLLMFWVILLSGIWSIRLTDLATFYAKMSTAIIFVFVMDKKVKCFQGKRTFFFLIFLLFFELFLHLDFEAWSTYFDLISCAIFGFFFVNVWGEDKISFYYRRVMFFITFVSLIGYSIKDFLLSISSAFPRIFAQSATYINYYFYLYCIESPKRNPGVFWEPGAFAVFIGIALFFELKDYKNVSLLKLLIYWIALITTGSTLGYTLLFITILIYILNTKSMKSFGLKLLVTLLGGFASFSALMELGIFSNLQQKLFSGLNSDPSSKVRNIGQLMDLNIFVSHPIFGVGYKGYRELSAKIGGFFGGDYILSANTFTYSLALFGIVFGLTIIFSIINTAFVKGKVLLSIINCFFIIWLFVTQNFINKPIFYILIMMGASEFRNIKEGSNS